MDKSKLQYFKKKLLAEKQSFLDSEKHLEEWGLRYSMEEATGNLTEYDQHIGDSGSEMYERSKDYGFLERIEQEIARINEALEAIETGEYGICANCGQEIGFERLDAIPFTNLCIQCQKEDEQAGNRFPPQNL